MSDRKAITALIFAFVVVMSGDRGLKQRPVYPGECLARSSDGELFVARAGERCVAMKAPSRPEGPAMTRRVAKPQRKPVRSDDFDWE